MEVVLSPNTSHGNLSLPFNRRNVEEWSRFDRLTGMKETAKIESDHWAASSGLAAHKYGKMVDSREINNIDGSIQQRQRKQMEVFQSQVPGGSMQVIRTQTVTSSSSSSKRFSADSHFDDLKLPINHLDLSSQKMKVSVGRSGSIGNRRPPTRPRSLVFPQKENDLFINTTHSEEEKKDSFFSPHKAITNGITVETAKENESPHLNLSRKKSSSSENITDGDVMNRTSKVRRSLQFSKPNYFPEENDSFYEKSLRERATEIENLIREGTVEKSREKLVEPTKLKKKNSFVSVATLKEVRERLKRTDSFNNYDDVKISEPDDGIESDTKSKPPSGVKSYVFGMEEFPVGKRTTINGTGSLESRTSGKNLSTVNHSEEWYNRRKSYGFEGMDKQEKTANFLKSTKTSQVESSTDSGICRSSEMINTTAWVKGSEGKNVASIVIDGGNKNCEPFVKASVLVKNRINIADKNKHEFSKNWSRLNDILKPQGEEVEKTKHSFQHLIPESPSEMVWNRKSPLPIHKLDSRRESLKSSLKSAKNPWISQLSGTKLAERIWTEDEWGEQVSAASDDSQTSKESENFGLKIQVAQNGFDESEDISQKKQKKVEFSKTEVHFAAEPGRLNIVETDEKPPSTNLFRRRRRNSGPTGLVNTIDSTIRLPEFKFGDDVIERERKDKSSSINEKIEAELHELSKIVIEAIPSRDDRSNEEVTFKNATMLPQVPEVTEDEPQKWSDDLKPRSILKNYRRSYILGDLDEKTEIIKPAPIWKSTVVLKSNTFSDFPTKIQNEQKQYSSDGEAEFRMCLKNLRRINNARNESKVEEEVMKRRSIPDEDLLKSIPKLPGNVNTVTISNPFLSVAERVKQVEMKDYSTKIHFGGGETKVVKESRGEVAPEKITFFNEETSPKVADKFVRSNPTVKRFTTEDLTTSNNDDKTRISINNTYNNTINNSITKPQNKSAVVYSNKIDPVGKGCLKSTSLVLSTIKHKQTPERSNSSGSDLVKPTKPVCEIVTKFNQLVKKQGQEKERRRTIPIEYSAKPKEYTQADLEEELKNFTENLDKDFKDIYEEEIESIRGSSKDSFDRNSPNLNPKPTAITRSHLKTTKLPEIVPIIHQRSIYNDQYDSEDSDIAADQEVRSYMSTGQDETDSDSDEHWTPKQSFKKIQLQFQKMESQLNEQCIKADIPRRTLPYTTVTTLSSEDQPIKPSIASISLRYEDDPTFTKYQLKKESQKVSPLVANNRLNLSNRERVSFLNSSSLSEKYSKNKVNDTGLVFSSCSSQFSETTNNASLDQILSQRRFSNASLDRYSDDSQYSKSFFTPSKTTWNEVSQPDGKIKQKDFQARRERLEIKNKYHSDGEERRKSCPEPRRIGGYSKQKHDNMSDSAASLLEELASAADQIILAVNGHDSQEEPKSNKLSKTERLGTITEGKRETKTNKDLKESKVAPTYCKRYANSSASSLESLSRDVPVRKSKDLHMRKDEKKTEVKTVSKTGSQSTGRTPSTRIVRLSQRANSREALLNIQQSSSEDIPLSVETVRRHTRRTRSNPSSKASSEATNVVAKKASRTSSSSKQEKESVATKESSSRVKEGKVEVKRSSRVRSTTSVVEAKMQSTNRERPSSHKPESISHRRRVADSCTPANEAQTKATVKRESSRIKCSKKSNKV